MPRDGAVRLNEVVQTCVAQMQADARRSQVLLRTALLPGLPPLAADPQMLRDIVSDVLANAIRSTMAGGQVIASTARAERTGDATLRVRDQSAASADAAREDALARIRTLAEAGSAKVEITRGASGGTLVEITFPIATTAGDL
jgi:hypothetical protein